MIREPMKEYCGCMEEIRNRSSVIANLLSGSATLGRQDYDYELVALHLRKILELIAFGSVIGNLEKYFQTFANAHKHWNAEKILADLEKVNPHFYPVPVDIGQRDERGITDVRDSSREHLTRAEFVTLYNRCGAALHIPNSIKAKRVIDFIHHPGVWLQKIHGLLETHYIALPEDGNVWLVFLNDQKTNRVRAFKAGPANHESETTV
jgi:hypothetical protein